MRYEIEAFWDDEAGVYVARNDELGITTESNSLDLLWEKLRIMASEAFELGDATTMPAFDLVLHDEAAPA